MSDVTINKSEMAEWAAEVEAERGAAVQQEESFFDKADAQEAAAHAAREADEAKAEADAVALASQHGAADQTSDDDASGDGEIEAETAKPLVAKKVEPLPKWMKERIAEQTAKQREAERLASEAEARALAAQAELDALRKQMASGDPLPTAATAKGGNADMVPRSEIEARAIELARVQAHNAAADQAYFAGKAAYKDFDAALEPLQHMGAIGRVDFQEAALATGNAADVLYALGSDPDKASQILGYLKSGNAVKAGIEMDRIARAAEAAKVAAAKPKKTPVSQAPAPIKPVGGSALPIVDLERADDATFDKEFSKVMQGLGW